MSNTRKILSVVMAIIMAVSMFAIAANAAYESEEDVEAAIYTQNWALSEPVDKGDGTYSVDVLLTTNYATGPIEFVLTNSDTTVATAISATLGAAIPEDYNATINAPKPSGKFTIHVDTSAGAVNAVAIDGVIATIVYSYSGSGSAEIAIEDNAKSATNPDGTLIATRMSNGDLSSGDFITGQTVTVGESVIIGGAAMEPAELVLTDVGVADGVIIDTHKTFGGQYAGVVYGFKQLANNTFKNQKFLYGTAGESTLTATNEGTLKVTKTSGGFGTGTTVEVLNSDGTSTGNVYVVVIFGDVTGDGLINNSDALAAYNGYRDKTKAPENSVVRLAANCAGTNAITFHNLLNNDAQAIYNHYLGTKLDAANLASKHASHNSYYQ